MTNNFRFNALQAFLTYPRCDLPRDTILTAIRERWSVVDYAVCQEEHEATDDDNNTGLHLHAYFKFTSRINVRDPLAFDVEGFHPNIQSVRNRRNVLKYISKKDLDVLTNIEVGSLKRTYGDILSEVTTKEAFLGQVLAEHPRDYVLQLERIEYFVNKHFRTGPSVYVSEFSSFIVPTVIEEWLTTWTDSRPKTLCLIGPTRTGKTEWARSIGVHMYFNGMFNIDDWNPDALYLVVDDFDWKFFPSKKSFWGAQKEFTVTDKYRKKKTVKWGRPLIYICNEDSEPFREMGSELDWFKENCVVVRDHRFF